MNRFPTPPCWFGLCSEMPRFGTSGSLTEQDIKDLVAYLLDPTSPVNK